MKRYMRLALALMLALGVVGTSVACSNKTDEPSTSGAEAGMPSIKVGTLQTDDLLPLWVAESEGFLKDAGLDVEIVTFQSAQEQVAAVTAGEIDAMMTDMVVPVQLTEAGTAMRAVTVMQGAPAGILAAPNSKITDIKGLANVPTGCSSNTVLEFIYDKALIDAGVPADQIKIEEIKKLPVRLEMLTSNKIDSAVLPWTLFAMAQKQGAHSLLDQAQDNDYTSTVLEFRQEWLDKEGASEAITKLLGAWQQGVDAINADPNAYRELLAEKAKLPEPLKESYRVRTYPDAGLPSQEQFDEVVNWMVDKGYIKAAISYDDLVYQP